MKRIFVAYPFLEKQESGKKGQNYPEMYQISMLFKAWLRGMYQPVLVKYCYGLSVKFKRIEFMSTY